MSLLNGMIALETRDNKEIASLTKKTPLAMLKVAALYDKLGPVETEVLTFLAEGKSLEDLEKVLLNETQKTSVKTAEVKEKKAEVKEKKEEVKENRYKSYKDMSTKELIEVCKKNKIKVPTAGRNKLFYLEKLKAAGIIGTDNTDDFEEVENDSDDFEEKAAAVEEETETVSYTGMTARQLFDLCKERELDVKPRQTAETYIELLKAADEVAADDDNEDWDDEDSDSDDGAWDI